MLSAENKMLAEKASQSGVALEKIIDGELLLEITGAAPSDFDLVLQRSVSYSRSLCTTYYWEKLGIDVVNSYSAAKICGDKFVCSMEMARAGIPTPKTFVAFSPESAKQISSKLPYPVVIKPVMGSWARMVQRLNDKDSLEAAIESREEMGNPWQKIYYMQEHVEKPGRDIRAFVVGTEVIAAIYRNSTEKSGWITNTGRGGTATNCPVTSELREMCLKAVSITDEGIYGVDLMESERGLLVHEINHTTEFRNSIAPSGVDIPQKIIDYAISRAKS